MTVITVEYPTESVTLIKKTPQQLFSSRQLGDNNEYYRFVTMLNQPQTVYVNQVKQLVENEFKTPEDYCLEQTGLTPEAYQSKFKRAWNE